MLVLKVDVEGQFAAIGQDFYDEDRFFFALCGCESIVNAIAGSRREIPRDPTSPFFSALSLPFGVPI